MQKVRKILCGLLAAGMMLAAAPLAQAAPAPRTVRVGVFSLGEFQYLDENGMCCGYNGEYLQKIAEVNRWSYEFVPVENWVDATEKLESGDIELLAPAQRTDALSEKFGYSAYAIGTEFAAVYTRSSRDDLLYEDFDAMAELRYGGAENSTFVKEFVESYSANAGFTPNLTLYANTTELFDALDEGEVDAVVTNVFFAGDQLKLLGRFSPMPVYYIAGKENKALLAELDDAIASIQSQDPAFSAELMQTYFPLLGGTQFTFEELQYIEQAKPIVIGYQVNHAPLSYTDEDGNFAGITRDVLDEIAGITGFTFQYVALPATNVTYEYLVEQQIHVLSNVEYNDVNLSKKAMELSMPFLQSEKVMVTKNDLEFHRDSELTIALATGSGTLETVIAEEYPNFRTVDYATVEECFQAVLKGTADATMQNRYVGECLLTKPIYTDLSVIPIQTLSDKLCLATMSFGEDNGDAAALLDGTFLSIVNKAIRQLTKEEINGIVIENASKTRYRATAWDVLYQYRYSLAAIVLLLILCEILLMRARRIRAKKNRELEQKNEALSTAIGQAERANQAKSQFLSRMSHEIRTPMNAIVGITAIARHYESDPERTDDYLSKIEDSSRVLLNIINDVLDMSAIESEKLKIASAEFDLKQVLGSLSSIYYAQCKEKGIRFTMGVDLADELVVGDALRVNQILLNLLSNAYKFTDAGGEIEVRVSQTTRKEDTCFLRFVVSDTGSGMTEEMQHRLFRPFEQESVTTAQKHGGSGLGMSITKNLVEMMHGAIHVESKKGEGTTFTVDLPFQAAQRRCGDEGAAIKNLRALVVDDEQSALEYTGLILQRIGVEFDMADSGAEAIRKMTEAQEAGHPYDLCFIDWKMPGESGVDVTRRIRQQFRQETMVIIISAYDLSEVEDEAKAAGADLFVSKPLFQSTVFNLLMQLSGGKYTKETADVEAYDFTGRRVLLAEDNQLNAEIATELLTMVHMQVDHAETGVQAVKMFLNAPAGTYDGILMDVQMPEMDGYEATRQIREGTHPQSKTVPIYAMTANAFTEDVSTALSAGMNGHIAKPIDTAVLYGTLKQMVQKSQR